MKHLKTFNESVIIQNWTKEEILERGTDYYKINNDGSIDVDGNVDISNGTMTRLPIKFNKVSGNFKCYNNKLTTLDGCPEDTKDLDCYDNNLYDFYGIGKINSIQCGENPVYEIYSICPSVEFIKYLNEFRPIRGNTVLGKRLEECLYMCDIDYIDVTTLKFKNYTLIE